MDFEKLIARVKAILLTPKTEWPVIAAEPTTVADLYKNYILILAAIPAIAGFITSSLIGYSIMNVTIRVPIGMGLTSMVVGYALSLAITYVLALIIDALAPNFGGEKNPVQALKTAAYSYTASWVAGAALILPWIGFLIVLVGAVYGIYLLYLGLPETMKAPKDKVVGYLVVTIVAAILLGWVVSLVVAGIIGNGTMNAAAQIGSQLGGAGR
ncbi:Yip1 family protein [Dokdonella sp.]|uniref:Yip1 family protein n=1 Tax=Dokdonella sp. TaxID=2291710 RepID=UPI0026081FF0|nr:Yip1 family protein [Dokdonella sp.]